MVPLQHPDDTVLGIWWFERESSWKKTTWRSCIGSPEVSPMRGKAVAQRSRIWPAKIKTPSAWLIGAAIVAALCAGPGLHGRAGEGDGK